MAVPELAPLVAPSRDTAPPVTEDPRVVTAARPAGPSPSVTELVDFKWLMVGFGHRVDLLRLASEAGYARACIALALASGEPLLARRAVQLADWWGLPRH
ncbi:MAG: hypothetical protein RIQ53_4502 [Pseudomonadota bacterium]|jgi:hypothetical protein